MRNDKLSQPFRTICSVHGGWAIILLVSAMLSMCLAMPVNAQEGTSAAAAVPAVPNKVELLLDLLEDKEVQDWIASRAAEKPVAEPPKVVEELSPGQLISERMRAIQDHIRMLVGSVPRIPSEFYNAALNLRSRTEGFGFVAILLLSAAFVACGLVAERLAGMALRFAAPVATPSANGQKIALGQTVAKLLRSIVGVAAFGIGSLGAFAVFPWPEPLRAILLVFLGAAIITLIVNRILRALLVPPRSDSGNDDSVRRIIPASAAAARHYTGRLTLLIGWYALGYAFVHMLLLLGMEKDPVLVIAQLLGLGLLAIAIETVWRRPHPDGDALSAAGRHRWSWLFTIGFVAMWIVWVSGASHLLALMGIALLLPVAIRIMRSTVYSLFSGDPNEPVPVEAPNVTAAAFERVARAGMVVGALLLLAWTWGLRFESLSSDADPVGLLMRRVLIVFAILLAIDMAWQLSRTLIDHWLEKSRELGVAGTPEAIRRAKIRTLLPILRNMLMVFLAVLAFLMALSTLGISIGPLIASAGVVGVAIGVGSQTLVKDIISGMFYLLDDAFRVGEYVVAGNYKGTVESFSLRSVRLRHHRGPVYTIPFGDLGAIQNLSRDFVIDKIVLTVTYDADLDKVRKLLKQVGRELQEDPELASVILEPLKMQRIDSFADYGIQIVLKVKTLPGEQFQLRQKALPLIKRIFDQNGIEFASPTVKIAEGTDHKAAAMQAVLDKAQTAEAKK